MQRSLGELFNPVAIRLQTGKRLRVEALVPFRGDDTSLAPFTKDLGHTPALDDLPVPKRNLFSFAVGVDRTPHLRDLDRRVSRAEARSRLRAFMESSSGNARVVGFRPMPALPGQEPEEPPLSDKQIAAFVAGWTQTGFPAKLPMQALVQEHVLAETDEVADFFRSLLGAEEAKKLDLLRLVTAGLEWQVGVHTYDTPLFFDMNWAELFAPLLDQGPANSDRFTTASVGMYGMYMATVVTPWYVSVPVRDEKTVDEFLGRIDQWLPPQLKKLDEGYGGSYFKTEYYRLTTKGKVAARAIGLHMGPVRLRVFMARIGNGLYLANQPGVLDDIKTALDQGAKGPRAAGPRGHALLRLRPANWDQAVPGFHLGWAEVQRESCLHNLGALNGTARALAAAPPPDFKSLSWDDRAVAVRRAADQLHGAHFYCPDGGRYVLAKDGKSMACALHGHAAAPRQTDAHAPASDLGRILRGLIDIQATVTIQPEGARIVVQIERR